MASRREFLLGGAAGVGTWLLPGAVRAAAAAGAPLDNPLAPLGLAWTDRIRWAECIDVTRMPGDAIEDRLAVAQAALAAKGGGVVYFPPGTYAFRETIRLLDGIVLRGADPRPVGRARDERYAPPTRLEFPKYGFVAAGEGTPVDRAFKGIELADPSSASNCGLVNVDIQRGHVRFAEDAAHACGVIDFEPVGSGRFPDQILVTGPLPRTAQVDGAHHIALLVLVLDAQPAAELLRQVADQNAHQATQPTAHPSSGVPIHGRRRGTRG